jgi:hypothetical protein
MGGSVLSVGNVLGAQASSRMIAGLLRAGGPPEYEHNVEVRGVSHKCLGRPPVDQLHRCK